MKEEAKDLQPLSEDEINEYLREIPGWEFKNNKISKKFEFANFSDCIFLLTHLAPFCNAIDHHPDVMLSYKKAVFELTRYSIGNKVTLRDFTVAKKIERLVKKLFLE